MRCLMTRRTTLGRQRRDPRIDRQALPGEGGDHEPVPEHDRPLAFSGPDREKPGLLAEGDDLEDVEEGQVLEIPGETHGRRFYLYTAPRIASAMWWSGTDLSTTPASVAAFGMP